MFTNIIHLDEGTQNLNLALISLFNCKIAPDIASAQLLKTLSTPPPSTLQLMAPISIQFPKLKTEVSGNLISLKPHI